MRRVDRNRKLLEGESVVHYIIDDEGTDTNWSYESRVADRDDKGLTGYSDFYLMIVSGRTRPGMVFSSLEVQR